MVQYTTVLQFNRVKNRSVLQGIKYSTAYSIVFQNIVYSNTHEPCSRLDYTTLHCVVLYYAAVHYAVLCITLRCVHYTTLYCIVYSYEMYLRCRTSSCTLAQSITLGYVVINSVVQCNKGSYRVVECHMVQCIKIKIYNIYQVQYSVVQFNIPRRV